MKKTEQAIETLEARNEELDTLMAMPENCTDVSKLTELTSEKERNLQELETLYTRWESLGEEMEE